MFFSKKLKNIKNIKLKFVKSSKNCYAEKEEITSLKTINTENKMTDSIALFDPSSAGISAGAGFVATIFSQFFKTYMENQTRLTDILERKTEIQDNSADKAQKRDADAGTLIRRLIYFGCAFTIIVAPFIFAFFSSIPVEVEERRLCGGWFWGLVPEWSTTIFHKIQGFYLPDSIQHAFISFLIPFYLGRGAAK